MKVIFEEYSGIIITAVAIIALIAVVGLTLCSIRQRFLRQKADGAA